MMMMIIMMIMIMMICTATSEVIGATCREDSPQLPRGLHLHGDVGVSELDREQHPDYRTHEELPTRRGADTG